MSSLMDKVRGVFSERQARKIRGFDELVQRDISGEELDPLEVAAVLDAAGKTPEEFEQTVSLAKNRETWQAMVDELPALQAAANQIEAKQKQLAIDVDREIQAIRQRQRIEAAELSRQLGIVARKIDAANEAAADLHKSKPPEVKAAEMQHAQAIRALMNERDAISEDMAITREFTHGSPGGRGVRYASNERRVAEIDKEIKSLQESGR
jgi:hypothetical protein